MFLFPSLEFKNTYSRTDPHVRINELTLDDLSIAPLLSAAVLGRVTAFNFGIRIERTVLPTSLVGVKVNLVNYVTLEDLLELRERNICQGQDRSDKPISQKLLIWFS